ncbi:hypothetical protein JCM10908_002062 [Rhodotorula pacifica]|uniref:C2H2-type zinc finger protein n=1 Tax=Rhodotorula pacifica TaxID=1495444 RepID=UPI00317138B4
MQPFQMQTRFLPVHAGRQDIAADVPRHAARQDSSEVSREEGQSVSGVTRNMATHWTTSTGGGMSIIEGDSATVPGGRSETTETTRSGWATAGDYRDFSASQSSPTSESSASSRYRTISSEFAHELGQHTPFGAEQHYVFAFESPGLAATDYSGPVPEQVWYTGRSLSGTAERYISADGYEQDWAPRRNAASRVGSPVDGRTAVSYADQSRSSAAEPDYTSFLSPAQMRVPHWVDASAIGQPCQAASYHCALSPTSYPYYASVSPRETVSAPRTHAIPILPPLPASPPLSAASYSLSPTGPTLSSFAFMSIGPSGELPEQYSGYIRSWDSPGVAYPYANRGTPPQLDRYFPAATSAPSWFRQSSRSSPPFAHAASGPGGTEEETHHVKLEPESSPELPPSPVDPAFRSAPSAPSSRSVPFSGDSHRSTVAGYSFSDDAEIPSSSSSDEGADNDSPEWTPFSSSPSSPRGRRAGATSRKTAASRRRASDASQHSPTSPRISPITGKPVKSIAKRIFPPRDADKRRFVCEVEGCGKSFGRPSARNTHMRSHSGQKPFTCPIPDCARSFSVFSNLKRHMVVHPTVDFRHVTVHDLPLIQWVPYAAGEDPDAGGASEGGRLEWMEDVENARVKAEQGQEEEDDAALREEAEEGGEGDRAAGAGRH